MIIFLFFQKHFFLFFSPGQNWVLTHGDLFEEEKFDILKLFGTFTIYHFYYFKDNYLKKHMYIPLYPLFSCLLNINQIKS